MAGPRRLGSTNTIRGHENILFFVCFVCFVVPTLGRAQAPRMASFHLPESARDHRGPACCGSTAQRLWNHETHEIHENPGPQAQGKGCRIGRFVCGRSKVNAYGRVPSRGGKDAAPPCAGCREWQRHPAAGPCWASGWKPLPLSLGRWIRASAGKPRMTPMTRIGPSREVSSMANAPRAHDVLESV